MALIHMIWNQDLLLSKSESEIHLVGANLVSYFPRLCPCDVWETNPWCTHTHAHTHICTHSLSCTDQIPFLEYNSVPQQTRSPKSKASISTYFKSWMWKDLPAHFLEPSPVQPEAREVWGLTQGPGARFCKLTCCADSEVLRPSLKVESSRDL